MSIFESMGGHAAVKTAVSVFYDRVVDDASLEKWFDGVDLGKLRSHQRAFLTAALGGPELFAGRDLATAHAGMAITDAAFTSIREHLADTLADLDVSPDIIATVSAKVESLRSQVVEAS
jgi:hemoglobin